MCDFPRMRACRMARPKLAFGVVKRVCGTCSEMLVLGTTCVTGS
jgi:hypothetical protein